MTLTCAANLDRTFVGFDEVRCGKPVGHDGNHKHHSDLLEAEWKSGPSPSGIVVHNNNTIIKALGKWRGVIRNPAVRSVRRDRYVRELVETSTPPGQWSNDGLTYTFDALPSEVSTLWADVATDEHGTRQPLHCPDGPMGHVTVGQGALPGSLTWKVELDL